VRNLSRHGGSWRQGKAQNAIDISLKKIWCKGRKIDSKDLQCFEIKKNEVPDNMRIVRGRRRIDNVRWCQSCACGSWMNFAVEVIEVLLLRRWIAHGHGAWTGDIIERETRVRTWKNTVVCVWSNCLTFSFCHPMATHINILRGILFLFDAPQPALTTTSKY